MDTTLWPALYKGTDVDSWSRRWYIGKVSVCASACWTSRCRAREDAARLRSIATLQGEHDRDDCYNSGQPLYRPRHSNSCDCVGTLLCTWRACTAYSGFMQSCSAPIPPALSFLLRWRVGAKDSRTHAVYSLNNFLVIGSGARNHNWADNLMMMAMK